MIYECKKAGEAVRALSPGSPFNAIYFYPTPAFINEEATWVSMEMARFLVLPVNPTSMRNLEKQPGTVNVTDR